jgi:hypothetical protein
MSWREQVTFDKMMMMSALYYTNMPSCSILSANTLKQADMLLQSDPSSHSHMIKL